PTRMRNISPPPFLFGQLLARPYAATLRLRRHLDVLTLAGHRHLRLALDGGPGETRSSGAIHAGFRARDVPRHRIAALALGGDLAVALGPRLPARRVGHFLAGEAA